MNWIENLLWGNSIAHDLLLLGIIITVGIILGKIKLAGVSLGVTMVLFVGIILSHFGFRISSEILGFIKEFGLVLFVYAIGMQVGPSFLSSLKKGGLKLNILASSIVLLSVILTLVLYYTLDIPMNTLVGILSGAVTNTPGLGAAQNASATIGNGVVDSSIALGYAVAYPLGVVGIILSIICIRWMFKINLVEEKQKLEHVESIAKSSVRILSIRLKNPGLQDKSLKEIKKLINRPLVVSRIFVNNSKVEIASLKSVISIDSILRVITNEQDEEAIISFLGEPIAMNLEEWNNLDRKFVSRRILVTENSANGKSLSKLNLEQSFDVSITRIHRSGIELLANSSLKLHVGDRITVVGKESAIAGAEKVLGNKSKQLNVPNLIPIFCGIALGVILGSIPIYFPGIPQPIRLGLAGGPLLVAIMLSIFGTKFKIVTYSTSSANFMLREIGISLFLACVGISAGERFFDTLIHNNGIYWVLIGFAITTIPLIIVGIIGRKFCKLDYYTLMGLLAGSTTDPPALAYSTSTAGIDAPAISYATVYPLVMFLRVMSAQLLILLFAS